MPGTGTSSSAFHVLKSASALLARNPPRLSNHLQPPPPAKKTPSGGGLAEGLRVLFQGGKSSKESSSPAHAHSATKDAPRKVPQGPRRLRVNLVLYSGGRDANTDTLGCKAAGVELAKYGRVKASQSSDGIVLDFCCLLCH